MPDLVKAGTFLNIYCAEKVVCPEIPERGVTETKSLLIFRFSRGIILTYVRTLTETLFVAV